MVNRKIKVNPWWAEFATPILAECMNQGLIRSKADVYEWLSAIVAAYQEVKLDEKKK